MSSRIFPTSPFDPTFRTSPLEWVRTVFVGFIQGLFAQAPRGMYHWEPHPDASELYVCDENPIRAEVAGKRPAISVTRGPVSFYTLGFDDMMSYSFESGSKKKGIIIPGTVAINCSSRVPLECEQLAWVIAEQLWANREVLMRAGFFEVGRQPSIGSPSPAGSIVAADEADEWYVVTVTVPYQFSRTTKVSPLGKKILSGIEMALRARLLPVEQQHPNSCGDPSSGNAEYPYSVQTCPPEPYAPAASDVHGGTPTPGEEPTRLPVVPHPLNPSQLVHVRTVRPNCPVVKPPSIGGRAIPILTSRVEESCGKQMSEYVTGTSTVKV